MSMAARANCATTLRAAAIRTIPGKSTGFTAESKSTANSENQGQSTISLKRWTVPDFLGGCGLPERHVPQPLFHFARIGEKRFEFRARFLFGLQHRLDHAAVVA